MQTFLPYPDFELSANCLDYRRLGKQRVEAKQIMLALENPAYGWQHHPAVHMWRGCNEALAIYGAEICFEWRKRGYNDSLLTFFEHRMKSIKYPMKWPSWLGDNEFHRSHRANLLRKDPDFYSQYWKEDISLPYIWPV